MTGSRHIVCVFAHPDDEAYSAAGTLAHCTDRGARVTIVSATRGEAGLDFNGTTPPGPALARRRSVELAGACEAIGANDPVFLDLPDGRLSMIDSTEPVRQVLSDLRPDVVITHGVDGAYGHRDHTALHAVVIGVAAELDVPRVLTVEFPQGHFKPIWSALQRTNALDTQITQDVLGIERTIADLVMHVAHVRDRKLAAVAAHGSQIPNGDPFGFLRPGVLEPLLDEEWFRVAHGPDLGSHASSPLAGL